MKTQLKTAFKAAVVALLATAILPAAAQTSYPNRPIRLLVGVPPGGSTDALTRIFGDWLQESTGQPTVVENKPGANTAIAADTVARAPADGYTLLVATEAHVIIPQLTKLSYDPIKSFEPVGTIGLNRFVLTVHPSVPVNTVPEFVAYAKARPGQLNFGSSGNAGTSHLGLEKFKLKTGVSIVHIPYRGAGPALTDAIAGVVQVSMWTPMALSSHTGKLKPLAVTGNKRLPALAQVPTFAEAGLTDFEHKSWLSVYAPAGTPKAVVDKLNTEISKMLASPKVRQRLDAAGVEPLVSTPEALTAMNQAEIADTRNLIRAANIKMD